MQKGITLEQWTMGAVLAVVVYGGGSIAVDYTLEKLKEKRNLEQTTAKLTVCKADPKRCEGAIAVQFGTIFYKMGDCREGALGVMYRRCNIHERETGVLDMLQSLEQGERVLGSFDAIYLPEEGERWRNADAEYRAFVRGRRARNQ